MLIDTSKGSVGDGDALEDGLGPFLGGHGGGQVKPKSVKALVMEVERARASQADTWGGSKNK